MDKFVAYYRVSSQRQGRSGLGLAAQRQTAHDYIIGKGDIVSEFCEIESGRKDDRAQLRLAISLAKRENAKLLIARLDRFSRRVSFIAQIMEQGIGLVCAEMPNASDFQLHIFAALAQEERRLISERTKAALAEAKRRGKTLGANGRYLAAKNHKAADEFAAKLVTQLSETTLQKSYSEIASELNERGILTATGKRFFPQTVKNYMRRIGTLSPRPSQSPHRRKILQEHFSGL